MYFYLEILIYSIIFYAKNNKLLFITKEDYLRVHDLRLAAIVGVPQLRGHVGDVGVVVDHESGVVAAVIGVRLAVVLPAGL
jgi:hypothetical protein